MASIKGSWTVQDVRSLMRLNARDLTVCPLVPQVEVTYPDGSPADGVRVRVKAELTPKDNVYTSVLTSRDGQATFEIPSIPNSAQYVWLEVSGPWRWRDVERWREEDK